jgi:hypothetical protein
VTTDLEIQEFIEHCSAEAVRTAARCLAEALRIADQLVADDAELSWIVLENVRGRSNFEIHIRCFRCNAEAIAHVDRCRAVNSAVVLISR